MENSFTFNLDLALAILKEEYTLDEITVMELKSIKRIGSFQELFVLLEKKGIVLESNNRIDIKNIYGIITNEIPYICDYRVIKVKTATKIRSLIGKWNPPSLGQMKINDVINDIYIRTCEKIQGEQYYYTGRSKEPCAKGKYIYKLIINGQIVVFFDLNRLISYHLLII